MADEETAADAAGRLALERVYACFDAGQSFRLEAGAGAGKTYSLEKALRRLIELRGTELVRKRQQIGCITFTNVAKDEIIARVQAHPAVRPETIHGFCWSVLQDFQPQLRAIVPDLPGWGERLADAGVGARREEGQLRPRLSPGDARRGVIEARRRADADDGAAGTAQVSLSASEALSRAAD
ncbi:UvrD-helicase domain-containing protein [Novosphingobium panipatense]|uniref:UvrD-helicase domain-containing protein n=1 Tax=Novosphingobium panipatense TaxID=428991 RepID=UPI0036071F8B